MNLDHRTHSLDEEGHRKSIHPTEVRGFWKTRRELLQFALLLFFICLPWLKVNGRPFLRLDIFERKFSVVGVAFQSHDTPLIFLFAISFILFFAFLTSLYGRVWCGWMCPQTVFIETVFRKIEALIEGNAAERRRAEAAPWDFDRLARRGWKWVLYIGVSLIITHSFLAIFVGPERLGEMIGEGPGESPIAFGFILLSTLIIVLDFGWFREQFCIVMCPYGRIQSVFQDTHSKTVAYDTQRGEPRGVVRKVEDTSQRGDCIDCKRCVQVCPTGVDIRNGSSQLECIACTACIDACDDVMKKLKKPLGLISYASTEELSVPLSSRKGSKWRLRSFVYIGIMVAALSSILYIVQHRNLAMVEVFKNRGAPFTVEAGPGTFGNLFIAEIAGHSVRPLQVSFSLKEGTAASLVMPSSSFPVPEGSFMRQSFTIRFPKEALVNGSGKATLLVEVREIGASGETLPPEVQEKELRLVGPY